MAIAHGIGRLSVRIDEALRVIVRSGQNELQEIMLKSDTKYTYTAIGLHWIITVLVLTLFALGWYMADLPKGSERSWFFATHKSIGLTVFALALMRIGWRLRHRPPALPNSVSAWRRRMATAAHRLFYVVIFVQPISGYLSSSFSGYKTQYFGIPLPHWGWKDPALNDLFHDIHVANSILFAALIVIHVAGALSHLFKPGDHLFRRILP